ncbi:uracil permease [Sporomusa acidovorans]|uniref:Uracil permease n=1 Tax=Sporomusa acidovorans (strain ATCC 49682 / DSM 3132 / Mol) TaxID=1123286 RepID=A0ABZ3J8V5_SPOA4|nr:uracil permease [Sporomusa acidovorans]OZC21253.1 uracil permease [Sporomusa acidovorans DSM 3132]SDE66010.1 uracil permease [Sporomusa acidovorans]
MRRIIQVEEKLPLIETLPLSLQHLFAMFGSTVLVPILFKVNPATVLLWNGIGTLLYILITKGRIPAYLGSSFAFLSPVFLVLPQFGYNAALGGFIATGLIFSIVALSIGIVGTKWIDIVFPPAAMGAIVAIIGLELAPVAAEMAGLLAKTPDPIAITVSLFTLAVTILGSVLFRGFMAVIPILIGIAAGYILALAFGIVNLATVYATPWFALPTFYAPEFNLQAILIIIPASLVVIAEHIGHLVVTGNIVGRDLSKSPGLHRSLLGNGISTMISGFFGSTPNTTYGENIGVMALSKVYSVWVIGFAAVIAIVLSFVGKLAALIQSIPAPVMGGVSLLLFGVIAASGVRILVESKVDYNRSRNLILTAVVLIIGVSGAHMTFGSVTLKGMALATIVAIILGLTFRILDLLGLTNDRDPADTQSREDYLD